MKVDDRKRRRGETGRRTERGRNDVLTEFSNFI
jgi:hypothetical protein